jgi:hypothetical protein
MSSGFGDRDYDSRHAVGASRPVCGQRSRHAESAIGATCRYTEMWLDRCPTHTENQFGIPTVARAVGLRLIGDGLHRIRRNVLISDATRSGCQLFCLATTEAKSENNEPRQSLQIDRTPVSMLALMATRGIFPPCCFHLPSRASANRIEVQDAANYRGSIARQSAAYLEGLLQVLQRQSF